MKIIIRLFHLLLALFLAGTVTGVVMWVSDGYVPEPVFGLLQMVTMFVTFFLTMARLTRMRHLCYRSKGYNSDPAEETLGDNG